MGIYAVPPKCGHLYNRDTSLVPKGVRIIGVPLYTYTSKLKQWTQSIYIAGRTALYSASTPLFEVVERTLAAVEQWSGSCGRLQHFSLCYWESLERLQAFVGVLMKQYN